MDRDTLPPPTMDLSAIVNQDEGLVLPRRSSSNAQIPQPSPVSASSRMPTPTQRAMPLKRKRYESKPIWAYRENEELPEELQRLQEQQRQQARPPPPPVQPPAQHQAPAMGQRNGPTPTAPATAPGELAGYERPVSNDAHVYDDVSRKVCDFIWTTAVNNEIVRKAIDESPNTQLEVEARWGQIIDTNTNPKRRLRGFHDTECVLRSSDALNIKFESTMTMEQHKRMNMYLNGQVQRSAPSSGNKRPEVKYSHTREIDQFYDLNQKGFDHLSPTVRVMISQAWQQSKKMQKVRVSKDAKTGEILRKLIKLRVANLEISSPQTEWDYRIGINLEINYPGPIEELEPSIEEGKSLRDMQRQKDRMSYSWLNAYQIDLTQVVQGPSKNHELELELDSKALLDEADKVRTKGTNAFEPLINGMLNNLRVLSREITPQGQT